MAGLARIPRSRGGVSGVLLILLGAWGGLAPFVGPYFRFAYTPDKAWAYTSGRLWLSVVPGAAALLGGLLVLTASHRAVGWLGAFVAALGGAWFVVGTGVIAVAVKNGSISPGVPLAGSLGALNPATRVFLEQLGFFTGTGVLILFFGALALGRFSVVGVKDAAMAEELLAGVPTEDYPADAGQAPESAGYPDTADTAVTTGPTGPTGTTGTSGPFPASGSAFPPDQAQTSQEQYPASASPFGRTPPPDTGPLRGPS
jgi:hypothetical protein